MALRPQPRDGFTLLEVLVATFVFAVVMGGLLTTLANATRHLATARAEVEAAQLAETIIRRIESEAQAGTLPELGIREGEFSPPSDHLAWILNVEPYALPLPEALARRSEPPSPLFEQPGAFLQEPPMLRVDLRVYPVDQDPEASLPFLLLLVKPVS